MKKLILLLLCITMVVAAGCATEGFARLKGRALKLPLPVYQGMPPEEYTYKSLGEVRGEYKNGFFDSVVSSMDKSLEDLVFNAEDMGANAVINIDLNIEKKLFIHTGEAVIFNELPE